MGDPTVVAYEEVATIDQLDKERDIGALEPPLLRGKMDVLLGWAQNPQDGGSSESELSVQLEKTFQGPIFPRASASGMYDHTVSGCLRPEMTDRRCVFSGSEKGKMIVDMDSGIGEEAQMIRYLGKTDLWEGSLNIDLFDTSESDGFMEGGVGICEEDGRVDRIEEMQSFLSRVGGEEVLKGPSIHVPKGSNEFGVLADSPQRCPAE
jgi:hypothetical protein